jgi:glycosyltransferase involved in cell wall biosynthesis
MAEDFNSDEIKDKITGEDRPCKLIFLSNMMKEKGVLVLLDACNVLKQKRTNFECHFVGAWSDVTELYFMQKIDEYGLNSVVFTHGARYGQEKLTFLKNADIFVFPTFYHYEAFPLVTLEAMQHGLPVISTPEGGIREIVVEGETGFLVPQHNILELALKIEVLINDPELRVKMGLAGRNRFMGKFTLNEFENRIATILKEVTAL